MKLRLQVNNGAQLTVRNAKRLTCTNFYTVYANSMIQVSDGAEVAGYVTNASGGRIILRDGTIGACIGGRS